MMGILVPETCWGNKTAYFIVSSWFLTFTVYDARSHEHLQLIMTVACKCDAAKAATWRPPPPTYPSVWYPVVF
jgi:hypothetical protein